MSKTPSIKVACVQHANSNNQVQNWGSTRSGIQKACSLGANLILLQELHSNQYFPQIEDTAYFDLAENIPGPSTEKLSQLAKENQVVIVGSIFEKRAKGIYHNTAVVLEKDGSLAGTYRKMHIPDDPGFYEKFYFTPGDLGFNPIKTSVGCLGVLVCWDQWFPEAARAMALKGADILLYPTAIGWDPNDNIDEQKRQLDAWSVVQRGHAVANGLPVAVCNRVGFEATPNDLEVGLQFWGNSFIVGPQGEILAKASEQADVILAEIDNNRVEQLRRIWPFFRDRRVDAYQSIHKIFDDNRD